MFKGDIYGHTTAIKVFNQTVSPWMDKQFQTEIEMLSRYHHRHINKLLAISFNGQYRCLVLEHMNGGALDSRLANQLLPMLQWRDRARILLHVARGLVYMHNMNPPVVHR